MANINTEEKAIGKNGLIYLWQQLKVKLSGKVDVEAGKGLSTNDFTTAEKDKLAGIAEGADKTIVEDVLTSTSRTSALSANQGKELDGKIKALSDSMGELGYGDMMKATYDMDNDGVVDNAAKLGGKAPADYALADGTNIKTVFTTASTRANIASAETLPTILGKISKYFADMKAVVFSGNYDDLINKPTIPVVTNDLTDELKGQYDAAYAHSQVAHAPADAQANIIEAVQVNGSAVAPVGKAVNIVVPTTVASLIDAADYAKKTDLTNVYKYKGSVSAFADLPVDGNVAGDVYNVESDGMNWGWNGTAWDNLGSIYTMEFITNEEIDEILAM